MVFRHYPQPTPASDPTPSSDAQFDLLVARINDLTRSGRANWIGLLAYLGFTMVTLLAVEDVDFFLDSRQTALPLIGVSIPTGAFFYAAPILGAALHVYVHLFVRKATAALVAPPPRWHGQPLEAHVLPWLLNDLVLRWRGDGAADKRPLDLLASITAIVLIWIAGPFVLGYAWWRAWPVHDPVMSFTGLTCFALASYASLESWLQLHADRRKRHRSWRARTGWGVASVLVAALLSGLTWMKVVDGRLMGPDILGSEVVAEGTFARHFPAVTLPDWALGWTHLATADLREQVLTPLPDDWMPYEVHKARFRLDWCARQGIDAETCGPPHYSDIPAPPHLDGLRTKWCADRGLTDKCTVHFARLDDRFKDDWKTERKTLLATLPRWSPSRKDLRGANLYGASLIYADLREAQMQGAVLSSAQMQGADLSLAQMQGADFAGAQIQRANLTLAKMQGANLSSAQMQGADLGGAQMQGAFLWGAEMQGADLWDAQMQGANLISAQMQGANLRSAQMQGADLGSAQMQGADLGRAQMQGAFLWDAQMQGADLWGAEMLNTWLSGSRIIGLAEAPVALGFADLSGSKNDGGALRFVDASDAEFDENTDWRHAFVDGTVTLPPGFPEPIVIACGWMRDSDLSEAEFFGRWHGWSATQSFVIPTAAEKYPAIAPPDNCQWDEDVRLQFQNFDLLDVLPGRTGPD